MATTIPVHQAIKFYSEANDVFNETTECPCDSSEEWTYIIKSGDITEVQITTGCTEVTYDADVILNGSFETQGVAPSDAADWTVDDTEKVERANSDPYIGQWSMRWNVVDNGTATQDTGVSFLDGDVYLLEFYVKVVNPITAYETPLEVYVGGQNYEVTPTEDYTKITIPVVFLDNGIDEDIIFVASNISPMADFMYVDFVVLRKVNYAENNCFFDLVYNGNFEYGQAKVTGELPVVASFDGWEIDGTVEADVLGGFDGTRCPVLYGTASIGQTWNVMADGNTYTIRFMARAATAGDEITVTIGATVIDTYTLTTQWEEYVLEYTATDDLTTLTFGTTDNEIYLDNVSISLVNFVNDDSVYVHDVNNNIYYTDPITINNFEGGYNALFGWAEILDGATPGCLQIITEFADENSIINSKFTNGTDNDFDDWTEAQGNGTIVEAERTNHLIRSQEFNVSWSTADVTVTPNDATAPDGSLTADKLTATIGSADPNIGQTVTTTQQRVTLSVWLWTDTGQPQTGMLFLFSAGLVEVFSTNVLLTTTPVRYSLPVEFLNNPVSITARIDLDTTGVGQHIYAWGAQLENDEYTTEYIPTTTTAVTVNDGVNQTRALRFNRNTNAQTITQVGALLANTSYVFSLFARKAHGSPSITISSASGTLGTITPDSSTLKRYTISFTTGDSDTNLIITSTVNSTGIVIDNLYLSESGTGVHYSELFTYLPSDTTECVPEIVWYDSQDEVFGINYESGFKNKMRIHDLNFQILSYPTDDFVKTLNGLESSISRAVIKKQKTLNITPSPEFIHDRLAVAVRHTNIEIDTVPYCSVEETTYTVVDSETGCRLKPAQVVLGIEGEILAERSINCEE